MVLRMDERRVDAWAGVSNNVAGIAQTAAAIISVAMTRRGWVK
jgi:hypothetical protein